MRNLENIPEGTLKEEVENALAESISDAIGVHPSNVEVEYNPLTGEVIYTITSDDAESLKEINEVIENNTEEFEDDVNANLVDEIDGITISEVTPPQKIVAEIEIVIDADSETDGITSHLESAMEEIENHFEENDYDIQASVIDFVTSAPTKSPTNVPSKAPITMIPSIAPSLSGWVATIVASSVATEEFSPSQIENLIEEVDSIYGVSTGNVTTEIDYEVSV